MKTAQFTIFSLQFVRFSVYISRFLWWGVLNTPSSFVSNATTGINFTLWAEAQRNLEPVLEQVEGRRTEVVGRVLSLRFEGDRSLAGLHLFATVILKMDRIC